MMLQVRANVKGGPVESVEQPSRRRDSVPAVLEFAWDSDAFRADHVIAALGLTRSTALAALDTLIDLGLVRELAGVGAAGGPKMGRPARHFELRSDAGLLVGVDAGDRHLTAMVADLAGRVLALEQVEGPRVFEAPEGIHDSKARQDAAFSVIDKALLSAGGRRRDVVAVGVGVPAPVDSDGGSPTHPAGFWQYMNAGLQGVLSREFPVVRLENDAALAAIAEGSLGSARGRQHYVAMLSGRRLGSGVVVGGNLLRGASGGIGELEALTYVSGVSGALGFGPIAEEWVRAALAAGRVPADHPWSLIPSDGLTAEGVLAVSSMDDPISRPLLEELGRILGIVGSVVSRFYDPEVIVICGAMAEALGDVIELASARVVDQADLPPPRILASGFGGDVVSIGALSTAREAAREIALDLFSARLRGRPAGGE